MSALGRVTDYVGRTRQGAACTELTIALRLEMAGLRIWILNSAF
jgi:hypothetical protein